jgi:DNA-binding MarR family transcriptional regulator
MRLSASRRAATICRDARPPQAARFGGIPNRGPRRAAAFPSRRLTAKASRALESGVAAPARAPLRLRIRRRQKREELLARLALQIPGGARARPLTGSKNVYTHIAVDDDLDLSDCNRCLCLASRRAARTITRAFDRHLRPHGLRVTQFTILVLLLRRRPSTIGDIADFLGLERTTLSRNLALIEAQGWVAIAPGEDARARIVSVTRKGRAAVAAALPSWRAAQDAATEAIGPSGVEALRALARAPVR